MASAQISSPPLPPSSSNMSVSKATSARNDVPDDDVDGHRSSGKHLRLVPTTSTKDKDNRNSSRLDPLSTQIYLRTTSNTEPTIAQRLLSAGRPDSPNPDNAGRKSHDLVSAFTHSHSHSHSFSEKDKKKTGSFLSRAIRGTFKKEDDNDSGSEIDDTRTDGSSARALTSVIGDGGGYIPFHKGPPRYIRVKAYHKKHREYNHMFLAQELQATKPVGDDGKRSSNAAIWAAEFSLDGRYLAVGGKDQVVRVYAVISTPEERAAEEAAEDDAASAAGGRTKSERLSAPVFQAKPIREYAGHTGEVLAVSWSKNNFLLTSSMDKTVRLWHLSRQECIGTFQHDDLVTSIAFHPTDDRFFLAGSLDAQLRLWSIPDKAVAFSASTTEFITAVAFSPDGKTAICGLLSGLCLFYETDGLKSQTQIHVRSSRGKNAKGSKITGIRTIAPDENRPGDVKVLITSNDSRVRIYNLKTKVLEVKFKGLENQSSQLHARFSDDGRYITSGSEDHKAYIWSTDSLDAELKDKQPYECFDAHLDVVTVALTAPTATKVLLSASQDPIYDLCNPPPVTLMSLNEANASQSALSDANTETGSCIRKPALSPAYVQRTKHREGNILVTTDRTGAIKVFRQDCASLKRSSSQWETSSKFSGRVGIGRSGSVVTRASGGGSRTNSRRESLNLGNSPAPSQANDLINMWRNDVEGRRRSDSGTRSVSPAKANMSPINLSASNLASDARKLPYMSSVGAASTIPKSGSAPMISRPPLPPIRGSAGSIRSSVGSIRRRGSTRDSETSGPSQPPTPSFSLVSASGSENSDDLATPAASQQQQNGFWNFGRWRGMSGLRNVTTISSTSNGSNGKGGHSRNPSESNPADRARARQSMVVPGFTRVVAEESADRRKSVGALFAPPRLVPAEAVEEEASVAKRSISPKRRTDSGVAQLSGSSEASE